MLCGFLPTGILAGSIASIIQSVCYGGFIAAGGLFSILQYIGTLGSSVLLTPGGLLFVGGAIITGILYSLI